MGCLNTGSAGDMRAAVGHDALSFTRLKQALGETDGSLGAHLRKLEDAEFVSTEKTFRSRRPERGII